MDTTSPFTTPPLATAVQSAPPSLEPPISHAQETPEFDMKGYAKNYAKLAIDNIAEILERKKLKDGVEEPYYSPMSRSLAAKEILDRGYGKAKQEVETKHILTYQDLLGRIDEREQKYQEVITVEYK